MANPPGVPNLLDPQIIFPSIGELLLSDTLVGYGAGQSPLWGIFQGGFPVVIADTVTSFGYKQDWAGADYPPRSTG